jgi:hypothetical protein
MFRDKTLLITSEASSFENAIFNSILTTNIPDTFIFKEMRRIRGKE